MSESIERYLERIGHKGPYENATHKCSCKQAAPKTINTATVRHNVTSDPIPERIQLSSIPRTRSQVNTRTIKVAPFPTPVKPEPFPKADTPAPIQIVNPSIIDDALTANLQNTGVVTPDIGTEVTLPINNDPDPISQTGQSNQTPAVSAGNTRKNAGGWLLGLLALGFLLTRKSGDKSKEE